nr:MAG TPA: hypothetical protein [Caudoviricetes sp.]
MILRGLPSIVQKNISLFVWLFKNYFVLLLCSQTETREDKSKNKNRSFTFLLST